MALLSLYWAGASMDGVRFEKPLSVRHQNFARVDSGILHDNSAGTYETGPALGYGVGKSIKTVMSATTVDELKFSPNVTKGGVDGLIPGEYIVNGKKTTGNFEANGKLVSYDPPNSETAGSIRNVNPTGGTQNCVNCAIATDNSLSVSPTSTLPGSPTSIQVVEETFGSTFQQQVSGQSHITSIMTQSGDGARGIVFGYRAQGEVGYVFNVVNQGGEIR